MDFRNYEEFQTDSDKITVIMIVFILYSALIVGLGLYVKYAETRGLSEKDKLKSFLTGGGSLGPISIGLITCTNLMSSGVMIGEPGLSYGSAGLIWGITCCSTFMSAWYLFGSSGKKIAVIKQRTGMDSFIQILRMRYNSKTLAMIIGTAISFFLLANSISQFTGGAKLFAVMSGTYNYNLGLVIFAAVTIIYTISGGVKSLARVAIVQGVLMVTAVLFLYFGTMAKVTDQYGSLEEGMRFVAENNPKLVTPYTWTFLNSLGTAFAMGFTSACLPNGVISTLTYNKSKALARGIMVSIIVYTLIQTAINSVGVLGYAYVQNLPNGDYVNPFLASAVLPGSLGGIVLSGSAAAIQSTAASFMLIIATTIMKDIYKDVFRPDLSDKKTSRLITWLTIGTGIIAIIGAMFPMDFMQLLNTFSNGGILCGVWAPLMFGLHWKKATPKGAICACIFGALTYLSCYLLQISEATKDMYAAVTGNCHPSIIGLAVSCIFMVAVSLATQKNKVEKGVFEVWFGKTYNSEYAKILSDKT